LEIKEKNVTFEGSVRLLPLVKSDAYTEAIPKDLYRPEMVKSLYQIANDTGSYFLVELLMVS
jgi:hypothetical protein